MASKQVEKILVVDDDPDVLDLIAQQTLGPQGYQVATADNGNQALQLAIKTSPDILITALDLPGLSGRDLLTALKSQGFESTVIALVPKSAAEMQIRQAFRLGARDVLTKPLREAELISSIDHALQEVRLRRDRQELAQRLSGANQTLEKRVKELTTLYNIGKAVTASMDLSQLFGKLIEGALFVTEAELGWLMLLDEATNKPILRAGKNLPNLNHIKLNQPWDDGLSSFLILSGEGIIIEGEALAKMKAGAVAKAVAAVPIKVKEQVVGVITVGNKTGKAFAERDQAMLSAVADYASIALVNARLFQTVEARARTLQKSFEELSEMGKQKDEMMLNVSRELHNPLLQAKTTLEKVIRWEMGTLTEHQTKTLRTVLEQLDALQGVIQNMTMLGDVSNRAPNPKPVMLTDFLNEALARMSGVARQKGVALLPEFPPEPARVSADPAQMSRVIDSLIANAIKFSAQGNYVTVRFKDSGIGLINIGILDNGPGIAPDKLQEVWRDSTARKAGPTGISLGLIKRIVEAHGGQAWAESEPGRGSKFYFSLVKA